MSEKPKSPGWKPEVIEGGGAQTPRNDISNTPLEVISTDELPIKRMSASPEDFQYAMQNLLEIGHVYTYADIMMEYIEKANSKRLTSDKHTSEQHISRKEISLLTLKNLADIILDSKETDWDARPSFYINIFLEYQARAAQIQDS